MTTENIAGLAASASRQALPYRKSSIKHFVYVPALILLLAAGGVDSAKAAQADLVLTTNTSPDPVIGNGHGDIFTCTYSFTVSNAGPAAATGVLVSNQLPFWVDTFISATGGSTPTNGSLLINLGSLAVGATNSVQIVVQCNADTQIDGVTFSAFTNVFQVYADQLDPDPTNNTAATVFGIDRTTTYTTSTRTIETNLTSKVNLQATNCSTELIAVMPGGTVLFDQTFNATFSDPSVQAEVAQAAGDLTGAGATSYTGPTETSFGQTLEGSSSVTVTNVIGTNMTFTTTAYIGPQTIMVGYNQTNLLYVLPGQVDVDTLVMIDVTNLVTTTNTDTYLNSAVYTMIAIVPQPQLGLAAVRSNQFGFTITGTSNLSIVVEACTNLATPSWTTLELYRFTNGPIYFSDPAWRSYPMRFYRTRLP
jgi:hypothetical protein